MNIRSKPLLLISLSSISILCILLLIPYLYTHISQNFLGARILFPSMQLIDWPSEPFRESAWKNISSFEENKKQRGAMLKNLLQTTNFSSMSEADIKKLLGPETAYFHHDGIVGYSLLHNGDTYYLGFPNSTPTLEKIGSSR